MSELELALVGLAILAGVVAIIYAGYRDPDRKTGPDAPPGDVGAPGSKSPDDAAGGSDD